MKDQERELKVLLSKEQADTLLKQNTFKPARIQTNTYYDTDDLDLRKEGMALRIRTIKPDPGIPDSKPVHILTIKKPLDSITKYEYEREIHTDSLSGLNQEEQEWIRSHLSMNKPLRPIAHFQTERSICELPQAEYSIDHTVFDHHDDYEAEYEYRQDHDGIQAFNTILKPAGVKWTENGPSKIARAMMNSK